MASVSSTSLKSPPTSRRVLKPSNFTLSSAGSFIHDVRHAKYACPPSLATPKKYRSPASKDAAKKSTLSAFKKRSSPSFAPIWPPMTGSICADSQSSARLAASLRKWLTRSIGESDWFRALMLGVRLLASPHAHNIVESPARRGDAAQ